MNMQLLELLPVPDLERALQGWLAKERACVANVIAYLGELDARQLYREVGFESMEEFCVHGLNRDEDEVPREISVARAAREFPSLFPAIEDGRLTLEAVALLVPHLTAETVDEWIAAATHRSESEIISLLTEKAAG